MYYPPPPPNNSGNEMEHMSTNSKNMKNILTKKLPSHLRQHILETYFWHDKYNNPLPIQDLIDANYMLDWLLYSYDAHTLKLDNNIFHLLLKLTKKKTCVKYLCSKDKEFSRCYIDHFINNNKNFKLMSKEESFFLSILMYKYH